MSAAELITRIPLSQGTTFAQDSLGSWREVNFAPDAAPNTPVYEMACLVRLDPKSIRRRGEGLGLSEVITPGISYKSKLS